MRKTLEKFHKIIESIISIEEIEKDDLILFKSEIILIDGSTLRISEVYIENNLEKYSYYWLIIF
ncbi:MAG: hypothetical protein ACE5KT_07040 [Methanosarcinales archaeon]